MDGFLKFLGVMVLGAIVISFLGALGPLGILILFVIVGLAVLGGNS